MNRTIGTAVVGSMLMATIFPSLCWAQVSAEIGVDALVARLGATAPNGAGVVVGQVEVLESAGNYGPDQSNSEFAGKAFIAQSGPPGNSGHATLVGENMYGDSLGMAPGIVKVYLYEVNSWIQTGFLRFNQGAANPPLVPPGSLKIFNHSWIGSTNNVSADSEILRRADFEVARDQTIMVVGVNNAGGSQAPLMCYTFNTISVGLANGQHVSGPTSATYDGGGRMKPEVVAPSQFTSFACPYVDATAARLVQAARTAPLSSNANAQRTDVIKAAIMAGCNHRAGWTNCTGGCASGASRGSTSSPLDAVYGADEINVDNSHLILTGMEQNGDSAVPTSTNITRRGWDFATVAPNASKYYRFHISGVPSAKNSILATWNRVVQSDLVQWSSANFNLTLWRVNASGQLVSLVGSAGLPYFGAGNVVSQSAVDNVEHLYITDLQPGDYVIQLQRADALADNRDVAIAWLFSKRTGDVNEDGSVNVADLLTVINTWGACPQPCLPACPADLNGDCMVNVNDLITVINSWGA